MSDKKPVAVQSYCFRGFKNNEEVAAKVKEIGLSHIEVCAVHADFTAPDTFDSVIKTYSDAGVGIVSIGVQGFSGDTDKERHFFEFAKKAGCTTISANFSPEGMMDAFKSAEKLADEFDINLGIHNHGGHHWLGNAAMLQYIFNNTSKRIGLMLDTAWALHAHQDPIKWIEKFGERVYGLHVKDFVFDKAGKHEDVVVGTGNLDMPAAFAALDKVGFDGNVIIEYEGDVNNPVPALKECVEEIAKIQ